MVGVMVQLGLDYVNCSFNPVLHTDAELVRAENGWKDISGKSPEGAKGGQPDKGLADGNRANSAIFLFDRQEPGAQE